MAGSVQITTRLILAEELPQNGQLSPYRAGSVLWEEEVTVMVEGLGSRFLHNTGSPAGVGLLASPELRCP